MGASVYACILPGSTISFALCSRLGSTSTTAGAAVAFVYFSSAACACFRWSIPATASITVTSRTMKPIVKSPPREAPLADGSFWPFNALRDVVASFNRPPHLLRASGPPQGHSDASAKRMPARMSASRTSLAEVRRSPHDPAAHSARRPRRVPAPSGPCL